MQTAPRVNVSVDSAKPAALSPAAAATPARASKRLNPAVHVAAGAVSGGVTCLVLQPLDLIKTRVQQRNSAQKIRGVQVVRDILGAHGVRGLWRGTNATLVRTVPGVGVYFMSLSTIKQGIADYSKVNGGDMTTPVHSLVSGALARTITGSILLPFTLVKVRYESGLFGYTSVAHGLQTIYRTDGMSGLYRGLAATLLRDAPFSGIYFMSYETLKKTYRQHTSEADALPVPVVHMGVGLLAGVIACTVTHPSDVIKTKMQVYPHQYGSTVDCTLATYRDHGMREFWCGFGPRLVRKSMMAAIIWTIYEECVSISQRWGFNDGY